MSLAANLEAASAPSPVTIEAILAELVPIVFGAAGTEEPFGADTRIDTYFEASGSFELIDVLDLEFRINAHFGEILGRGDWDFLSGWDRCQTAEEWEARFAPLFTFGRLAELICVRLRLDRVEPLNVLGASSLAAGAFRRIQAVVHKIDPRGRDFAPSTPILDRLRGARLRRVWASLRALSSNRVPPLPESRGERWGTRLRGTFGVCLVVIAAGLVTSYLLNRIGGAASTSLGAWLIAMIVFGNTIVGVLAVGALILSVLMRWFGSRLEGPDSMLPPGVRTFRDLAELVAGDREGFCAHCAYELTGVQGNRCPECGTIIQPAFAGPAWMRRNAGASIDAEATIEKATRPGVGKKRTPI